MQIQALREQIEREQEELARLEELWREYQEQHRKRQNYLSSKEIIELIQKQCGQSKNMTAIKRWADRGELGEKTEEREQFPLLVHKQGNKRFLFPKPAVYQFLMKKGIIRPRFDILDQVIISLEEGHQEQLGVIIQHQLDGDRFIYTIQVERTGEIITDVEEISLGSVEEEA